MIGNYSLLFLVFFPMFGAILCYVVGKKNKEIRDLLVLGITVIEFLIFLLLFVSYRTMVSFEWRGFCYAGLYLSMDGFQVLYGLIASFMWMMTAFSAKSYFSHSRNRNRFYFFYLLTLGATIGVFLSGDLFTTFIFFEIMSFASYPWVANSEKEDAMRAAETYLFVAVIGGLVLLLGLFLLYDRIGTLRTDQIIAQSERIAKDPIRYVIGGCMLFGFGAKAGMFPLHIWLPKAHPVAPSPASALLSGILTKSGIFGILVVSSRLLLYDELWGNIVLFLGVITMFLGALLGVFSNDLKRTLALSSMSQIGFILLGIGMQSLLGTHNALAVRGTILHMVNHSLIKLTLFMISGIVVAKLHKLNLNDIRGFGRGKPVLLVSFLIGAVSLMGIPLGGAYVSKTLLHESIVEYIVELEEHGHSAVYYQSIEWIFLVAGGLTIAYMLKLFIAIFIEKNIQDPKVGQREKHYMDKKTTFAIGGSALVILVLGLFPYVTQDKIATMGQGFLFGTPPAHAVHYFAFVNVKGALISITIGVLTYLIVVRGLLMRKNENGEKVYIQAWPEWLDLENLVYRPLLLGVLPYIGGLFARIVSASTDVILHRLDETLFLPMKKPMDGQNKRNRFKEAYYSFINQFEAVGSRLSFNLLMFSIGFAITICFLVFDRL
ncbi:MAG: proton-conducting transporter membrane subunit [bacterium]|nr:proton-conducting transporter membrane subunit [bacterium]